jgi:ubiquinone/menaquinone biosynthesis C-methylase UbiE
MEFKLDNLGQSNLRKRIDCVLPYIKGELLDVGCGGNYLVKAYNGKGTGVDVHPWDGVDIVIKDSAKLPFENERFDTVTILAALNHITNRDDVLIEAYRVLKKDGIIIVTMLGPKFSKFWHFIRKTRDPDQHERHIDHEEVWGFTDEELVKLLENAKFQVTIKKKFNFGLNKMMVARK